MEHEPRKTDPWTIMGVGLCVIWVVLSWVVAPSQPGVWVVNALIVTGIIYACIKAG